LRLKPNLIFYLSGNSNPSTSKNHIYDFTRSNIPLQNFLEAAKNINFKGKIFFSSSIAVYGNLYSKKNIDEENSEPANFYGLSKLIAEKQIRFYVKNYNLDVIILRLASFFGPELKKQFIYEFTKKALKKNNIYLRGHNTDKRDFLTIDYLIQIILLLIKKKIINYRVINIGSNNEIMISKVAEKIVKKLKIKRKILFEGKVKSPAFPKMSLQRLNKIIDIKNKKNNFDKVLSQTISYIKKNNGKN
jgi:UDP-glucose 4-epimerase